MSGDICYFSIVKLLEKYTILNYCGLLMVTFYLLLLLIMVQIIGLINCIMTKYY